MDVKCSKVFFDEAKKMGCIPIMERTGHSPIKEKNERIKISFIRRNEWSYMLCR